MNSRKDLIKLITIFYFCLIYIIVSLYRNHILLLRTNKTVGVVLRFSVYFKINKERKKEKLSKRSVNTKQVKRYRKKNFFTTAKWNAVTWSYLS